MQATQHKHFKQEDVDSMRKQVESLKLADQGTADEDVIISRIEKEEEDAPTALGKHLGGESDLKVSVRDD